MPVSFTTLLPFLAGRHLSPSRPHKHELCINAVLQSFYLLCLSVAFHAFLTPRGCLGDRQRPRLFEGAKTFLSLTLGLFRFARETHSTSSTGCPSRPPATLFFFLMGLLFPFVGGNVPQFLRASKPRYICGIEIGKVSSHDQTVFE